MASKLDIENFICCVCNSVSLTNCIFCDLCRTWLHSECLKLPKATIKSYSKSKHPFYCNKCLDSSIPFISITNQAFISTVNNHPIHICYTCNKTTNHINSIYCTTCKHRHHLKCVNIKPQAANKLNLKYWSCNQCHTFPFSNLDNKELSDMDFNSLTSNCKFKNIKQTDKFNKVINMPSIEFENIIDGQVSDNIELDFAFYSLKHYKG